MENDGIPQLSTYEIPPIQRLDREQSLSDDFERIKTTALASTVAYLKVAEGDATALDAPLAMR